MGDFEKQAESLYKKGHINERQRDLLKQVSSDDIIKLAIFGGSKKPMVDAARDIIQTIGLGALAVSIGGEMAKKIKGYSDQKKSYEQMIEKTPQLKEYPRDQIKDFFGVVKTFSPKAASNPLVAGALVNKMLQFGSVDHKLVQDISNIEGPQQNALADIASSAAKSLSSFPKEDSGDDFF